MATDKELNKWIEALAKGILLGGSIGVIAGWFNLLPPTKAVALGGLAGILAAINFKNMREKKDK